MTRYKLCQVLAKREGYGKPGAIPTVRNNPLDLRHGPLCAHYSTAPNDIGYYLDATSGWADADRQVELWAARKMTLAQMVETMAPPGDGNDTDDYTRFVCNAMGMIFATLVSDALAIPYDTTY